LVYVKGENFVIDDFNTYDEVKRQLSLSGRLTGVKVIDRERQPYRESRFKVTF